MGRTLAQLLQRHQASPPSLVQRLSHTLTWAVLAVWLLSSALVAGYVDGEIQHNFDVELIESTHRQLHPALLELHSLRSQGGGTHVLADLPGDTLAEPLLMQLRDAKGAVLLRTAATPSAPFAVPLQAGFYDTVEHRVFSLYDAEQQVWLQLADPLAERNAASTHTLMGLAAVLLVMLPVLIGLIRWIAERELRHVHDLRQQITARSGSNLQALALDALPRELRDVGEGVNQLLERLGEALNAERSLAANAAHELRTPLAQLRLRLQTAIDQANDRAADGNPATSPPHVPLPDVQAALQALATLSHRTERLLQLSRAEGGDRAHFTPVDLVQLAEQVAQEFWQQPAGRQRLDWLAPECSGPVWVEGDIDSLAIVLRNLVDNALYHTAAAVEISVRPAPTPALLVRDHGAGLSAAQCQLLQQRHARLDRQHMGYGLGMSIVRSILATHGAQMQLQSPPPEGGTGLQVRIDFAASAPAPEFATAPGTPPASPSAP